MPPFANFTVAFLAVGIPALGDVVNTRILLSSALNAFMLSSVESVDPSSKAINSQSVNVCRCKDLIALPIVFAALRAIIRTDTATIFAGIISHFCQGSASRR